MFENGIHTEDEAYWLGFITADGSVDHNPNHMALTISLHPRDRGHLETLQATLGAGSVDDFPSQSASTFRVYDAALVRRLARLGVNPRKAFSTVFPRMAVRLRHHFIRGVFDGDGCLRVTTKKQLRWHITGSEGLLLTIQEHLISHASVGRTQLGTMKNGSRRIEYEGTPQVRRILAYLYRDSTVWLPRKKSQ